MKLLAVAVAISFAAAGCGDRTPKPKAEAAGPAQAQTTTPSSPATPANAGTPTMSEKKAGSNPVQGQVDPKASEQQRDFKQSGDAAGPKSPETTPQKGGVRGG